jgi:hypothetical protein
MSLPTEEEEWQEQEPGQEEKQTCYGEQQESQRKRTRIEGDH